MRRFKISKLRSVQVHFRELFDAARTTVPRDKQHCGAKVRQLQITKGRYDITVSIQTIVYTL